MSQEDFYRICTPRVDKILAQLRNIERTAASQKVGLEEVQTMLAPIVTKLEAYGAGKVRMRNLEEELPLNPPKPGNVGATHWNRIVEIARHAPMAECAVALQIIGTRMENDT